MKKHSISSGVFFSCTNIRILFFCNPPVFELLEEFNTLTVIAEGGNEQQLTLNDSADVLPAWSPDGAWITFVSDRDGDAEIYLMDTDGSHEQQLTFNDSDDWVPAWSPLCR